MEDAPEKRQDAQEPSSKGGVLQGPSSSKVTQEVKKDEQEVKKDEQEVDHDEGRCHKRQKTDHVPDPSTSENSGPSGKNMALGLLTQGLRMAETDFRSVYVDLETSDLQIGSDINQIAAVYGESEFNCYVTPTKPIPPVVTNITGLSESQGVLYLHGKPLETISMDEALRSFIDWLRPLKPCMLLAHKAVFDAKHFFHHLNQVDLYEEFTEEVYGFSDTIPIFRKLYPWRTSHRQVDLVRDILGRNYQAHNAVEDAKLLQELSEFAKVDKQMIIKHSGNCAYWKNQILFER